MSWNLLGRPGWPRNHRYPPACATAPGWSRDPCSLGVYGGIQSSWLTLHVPQGHRVLNTHGSGAEETGKGEGQSGKVERREPLHRELPGPPLPERPRRRTASWSPNKLCEPSSPGFPARRLLHQATRRPHRRRRGCLATRISPRCLAVLCLLSQSELRGTFAVDQ